MRCGPQGAGQAGPGAGTGRRSAAAAADKQTDRKGPGPVRNITDPDARLMPVRGGGFIQGYNAQNVASHDGLIIATELTQDPTDFAWFEPMLRRAEDAAAPSCPPATRPPGRRPRPPPRTPGGSGCSSPTPATCPSTT